MLLSLLAGQHVGRRSFKPFKLTSGQAPCLCRIVTASRKACKCCLAICSCSGRLLSAWNQPSCTCIVICSKFLLSSEAICIHLCICTCAHTWIGSDNPNKGLGILKGCHDNAFFTRGSWHADFVAGMHAYVYMYMHTSTHARTHTNARTHTQGWSRRRATL